MNFVRVYELPEPFSWDEWSIREATCPTFADVEAVLRQFGIAAQDVDFIDFVQEIRREDREPST